MDTNVTVQQQQHQQIYVPTSSTDSTNVNQERQTQKHILTTTTKSVPSSSSSSPFLIERNDVNRGKISWSCRPVNVPTKRCQPGTPSSQHQLEPHRIVVPSEFNIDPNSTVHRLLQHPEWIAQMPYLEKPVELICKRCLQDGTSIALNQPPVRGVLRQRHLGDGALFTEMLATEEIDKPGCERFPWYGLLHLQYRSLALPLRREPIDM